MKNPNCDNDKCTSEGGIVRVLPVGGSGNLILCHTCYQHEMDYRRLRNLELSGASRFDLPEWDELAIYGVVPE